MRYMCEQVPFAVDGKVMQYMITRAALLLRAYPTTLQQDQLTIKETTVRINSAVLFYRDSNARRSFAM